MGVHESSIRVNVVGEVPQQGVLFGEADHSGTQLTKCFLILFDRHCALLGHIIEHIVLLSRPAELTLRFLLLLVNVSHSSSLVVGTPLVEVVNALLFAEVFQLALRFVHLGHESALRSLQLLNDLFKCLHLLALQAFLKLLLSKLVLDLRVN